MKHLTILEEQNILWDNNVEILLKKSLFSLNINFLHQLHNFVDFFLVCLFYTKIFKNKSLPHQIFYLYHYVEGFDGVLWSS